MESRYVIVRIFAKNKFANKKEFTGGEIFGQFNSILEVTEISNKLCGYKFNQSMPDSDFANMVERRLKLQGFINVTITNQLSKDVESKLITNSFDEPIPFIILDTKFEYTDLSFISKVWSYCIQCVREIKIQSLDIK